MASGSVILPRIGFVFNLSTNGSNVINYSRNESEQLQQIERNNMKGFDLIPFTSTIALVDAYESQVLEENTAQN